MTVEQVKEEAKKRFDKELTDEQARALLAKGTELSEEDLDSVAGGWAPVVPPRVYSNSWWGLPSCSCGSTDSFLQIETGKIICTRCKKRIGYRTGIHEAGRNYVVTYDANGNEVKRT